MSEFKGYNNHVEKTFVALVIPNVLIVENLFWLEIDDNEARAGVTRSAFFI